MGAPLYNEFGVLPAQHAAAAAQHPMLAPRPIDPATMGYHSIHTFETAQSTEGQPAVAAPQFYYPAPPTQISPQTWPAQPPHHHPYGSSSSGTADSSQVRSQITSSNEEPVQYQESIPQQSQHPQPIIYWSNVQQGQGLVPGAVPPLTGGSQVEGPENPLFPQVWHTVKVEWLLACKIWLIMSI